MKKYFQQHFRTDKSQQNGQSEFQKTEHTDDVAQQKEQRPQSDNRKNVGKEDDIRILRDGKDSGNRIHRKNHIGKLDDNQQQKQGGKKSFSVYFRYKFFTRIIGRNGETATDKFYQFVFFYVHFFFFISVEKQFDRTVN